MLLAGIDRKNINPFPGVELTGWGYYIERRWQQVHDDLNATALAAEKGDHAAIIVALDLMLIDDRFTQATRELISAETGVPTSAILLTCSHSHNAPAAGGLRGVGECDRKYEDFASQQATAVAVAAWNSREAVVIRCGTTKVDGISFNRTRENGVVDSTLTAALFERLDGTPLSIVVNYGAHPTVCTDMRPWDVSRDVPGAVCDRLEDHFPSATAMYIQGACGDCNFLRDYKTPERCNEPVEALTKAAVGILESAEPSTEDVVRCSSRTAVLPTRRWLREEIDNDRHEAVRRLAENDFSNWRETIGRCMTNRPNDMVTRHGGDEAKAVRAMCRFQQEWTDLMLKDFETRAETLETEVQAIRIGPFGVVANSCEFFSPLALDVRARSAFSDLMVACYSNGRIGYLPDQHDIDAKSYAGYQSPKYCNQFPFTAESGPTMCAEMLEAIGETRQT